MKKTQQSVKVQLLVKTFPVSLCAAHLWLCVWRWMMCMMRVCSSTTSSVVLSKKTALRLQLVHPGQKKKKTTASVKSCACDEHITRLTASPQFNHCDSSLITRRNAGTNMFHYAGCIFLTTLSHPATQLFTITN